MNPIQDNLREIRKEFFAFRNGIVADKLRKAGDPHGMIMGCLLADIMDITNRTRQAIDDQEQLAALAQGLWDDTNSRECRLAAPMLYPAEMMDLDTAMLWCSGIETIEIADNLCHKLLRNIDKATTLYRQLIVDERPLTKYAGYRLLLNLLMTGKEKPDGQLRAAIKNEASNTNRPLATLLNDILEELD